METLWSAAAGLHPPKTDAWSGFPAAPLPVTSLLMTFAPADSTFVDWTGRYTSCTFSSRRDARVTPQVESGVGESYEYETHAPLLCGTGNRGGALVFQASAGACNGSRFALSYLWPAVARPSSGNPGRAPLRVAWSDAPRTSTSRQLLTSCHVSFVTFLPLRLA